jgi:hypothetical protein
MSVKSLASTASSWIFLAAILFVKPNPLARVMSFSPPGGFDCWPWW